MKLINPFTAEGNWYKAQFHAHTTRSDGVLPPEELVRRYKEKEFNIVAITDHRLVADAGHLCSENLLVVNGAEVHPACGLSNEVYHLVCLNLPVDFAINESMNANEMIKAVKAAGGEVILAHPYWIGLTMVDILTLEGLIGMEVFNSVCMDIGKGLNSVHWDNMLAAGRILPAVATDDVHKERHMFGGWTWLKMKELTVEFLMDALRNGCYYASSGPEIYDFRVTDGWASVKCSPAAEVYFMCKGWSGFRVQAEGGKLVEEAHWQITPDAGYVRVEVIDGKGKKAWTNPVML